MAENYGIESAYSPAGVDGVTVTTGAVSAEATLPNGANGQRAKLVRLMVTANCYIQFGHSQKGVVTATANSMLLSPNFDVLVNVRQFDKFAYLQEAVGAKLNVTPLEA